MVSTLTGADFQSIPHKNNQNPYICPMKSANRLNTPATRPGQNTLGDFHDDGWNYGEYGIPEYDYDANGNMVSDRNRSTKLQYGLMHNMPIFIRFDQTGGGGGGGGGSIHDSEENERSTTSYSGDIVNHYTYQGRKLGKQVYNSQHTLTVDELYYDELMLSFGAPARISHEDGYIALDENGDATFYYYLKDHLGNVRSVIIPDANNLPVVSQANDYFPFGMSYSTDLNANKFLYNSKEEQEMPGRWLDYGFRFYDSHLARFHSVDPLAEKYYPISPYVYVANNPLIYIDPDGREIWIITDRDSQGNAQQVQYREGNLYNEDGSEYEGDNEFALGLQSIFNALYALGDGFTSEVLSTVEDSGLSHFFDRISSDDSRVMPYPYTGLISDRANEGSPVNTHTALYLSGNSSKKDASTVAHELRHIYDYDKGKMKGEVYTKSSHKSPKEIRAVNLENRVRARVGRALRNTYGGEKIDPNELLDPIKPYSE